jgi:hypothetical protein
MTPPAPTPPPQSALGLAPGAAPPGPTTVWSKLGLSPAQREFRQRQFAETPVGKLAGAVVAPFSRLSGGLIKPLAPPMPTLQQLLDKGPIGAAAKVKADELNAPKRKQAVEELEDVDCHYWPEAEDALIGALRTDRSEDVRLAAARVLGSGKCCTKKTIEALSICASGSDRDGAPCEVSAAVRAAADKSLEKCLACPSCLNRCGQQPCECPESAPAEEKPREEPPRVPGEGGTPAAATTPAAPVKTEEEARQEQLKKYYAKLRARPTEAVVERAREVLTNLRAPPSPNAVQPVKKTVSTNGPSPELLRALGPRLRDVYSGPRPSAILERDPEQTTGPGRGVGSSPRLPELTVEHGTASPTPQRPGTTEWTDWQATAGNGGKK